MNKVLTVISITMLMTMLTFNVVKADTVTTNVKKYTHDTAEWQVNDISTDPQFIGKKVFTAWNYNVKDNGMVEQYVIAIAYDDDTKLAVDNTQDCYTYIRLFGSMDQPLSANSLLLYRSTENGWTPFTPYNENCTVYKYDNYVRMYHPKGWFAPQESIGDVYTGSYLDDSTASVLGKTIFFTSTSNQLRHLITTTGISKVVAEVLALMPTIIPVMVTYIALRKGYQILVGFLKVA